ncbi:MAG: glycosyltransferase family 39 protein [Bacteroidota bacterium]
MSLTDPLEQSSSPGRSRTAALLLWRDPDGRRRLVPWGWLAASLLLLIALLPPLFLPLGPDEAMFFESGRKILQGAIHYRDIVDVKPPLIYYTYALAILIFGPSDFGMHLFDLILQSLTCVMIIALVRHALRSDLLALASALCYALLYSGQRFGCEGQSESYCGLIGCAMLWLLIRRRSAWGFIAVGLLAGVLAMLKLTLGAMLGVAMLGELMVFRIGWRAAARHCGLMLCGFLPVIILFAAYIIGFGATGDFGLMMRFTAGYAAIEASSVSVIVHNFIVWSSGYFLGHYSVAMLLLTIIGCVMAFSRRRILARDLPDATALLRLSVLAVIILFITISIEGRHYVYHYSRLYAFGAIVSAAAAGEIIMQIRASQNRSLAFRAGIWVAAIAMLPLGPLPRYLWRTLPVIHSISEGTWSMEAFYDRMDSVYPRMEMKGIGKTMRSEKGPDDELFVVSSLGALVYQLAGEVPRFKIYHSAFLIADFAPQEWRDSTSAYILRRRPRFIVAQRGDSIRTLTGNGRTSIEALRALPGVDSLLHADYRTRYGTPNFVLFKRRDDR